MRRTLISRLTLAMAAGLWTIGQCAPAAAQNAQASGLAARGAVAPGDIIPCQPAGDSLAGCTAASLQDFVTSSVKAYGAVGDGLAATFNDDP